MSLSYFLAGLLVLFVRTRTSTSVNELAGFYDIIHFYSMIVVYPIAGVIGVAFFRFFPARMEGRHTRRALFTGTVAATLIWSGLGELLVNACDSLNYSVVGMTGWFGDILILSTPFAVFLMVAHALALVIPYGPSPTVPPRRLTRPVFPGRV